MLCSARRSPDTNWSWVVCIAATLCNVIQFGFISCFGVFLPVLSSHFKEGRERTGKVQQVLAAYYINYLAIKFPIFRSLLKVSVYIRKTIENQTLIGFQKVYFYLQLKLSLHIYSYSKKR